MADVGGVVGGDPARVHEHVLAAASNGTTARRTVSYRRIGGSASSRRGGARVALDPRQLRRDPGLVAHVELQQDGGERLDGGGVGQLAGIERAAAGILSTISLTVRTAIGSSPQISTSESIGSPRCPSSLAGRWCRAATTWHPGTAACTWAATLPRGGTSGWNS